MSYNAVINFQDGVTKIISVREKEKLLDAALRNGISLPINCREGVCATCRGLCESGSIKMEYVDEDALNEEELEKGYFLACQTTLQSSASFYFDVDSSVCNVTTKKYSGKVTAMQQVSDAAAILELAVEEDNTIQYLPGQYARIYIPGTEQHRAYSFATANVVEGKLKFLIRLLPEGVMSDYLRERCQVGDELFLELPYGAFYLRETTQSLLLIAGGTGLSAILSILDALVAQQQTTLPIRVIYGARCEEDISELERLEAYASHFTDYKLDIVLNEAKENWQGKRGYVTDAMDLEFLQNSFDAYLCGPPLMITAAEKWFTDKLENHEIAAHKIYFEKFISS